MRPYYTDYADLDIHSVLYVVYIISLRFECVEMMPSEFRIYWYCIS